MAIISEEAQEKLQDLPKYKPRMAAFVGIGLVVGIPLGFAGGYFWAKRQLTLHYSQMADLEIAKARQDYIEKQRELAEQQKPNPADIVTTGRYTPAEREAIDEANEAAEEEAEVRNVFVVPESGWDYAVEVKSRDPNRPYVIHVDEFNERNSPEYDGVAWQQGELTYYVADDILVDEETEEIIDANRESLVGEENLLKFGHGSQDPNVVYIRNDHVEIDMEISRSPGRYADEAGAQGRRHRQLPDPDDA